jgi:REP element-mobilizing transposase RayT
MTYARAHLVDPDTDGFYHCISRCVRRGWLCGIDAVTGTSYEHRKDWVESRILTLCEIFTLNLSSYAVMSNHYHVVVEIKPSEAKMLNDEEVAQRWLRLSSKKRQDNANREIERLLGNPERIEELRQRLGSLSWLMKYMNEPLARAANREDGCKGRFWEGRFKSIALLDEPAVVGCMAYVDLNPVRAGITDKPEEAPYTSIRWRMVKGESDARPLVALEILGLTLPSYLELLRWTARVRNGGVARPQGQVRQTLQRLGHEPAQWFTTVKAHRFKYRAYGALDKRKDYAQSIGPQWIKGSASNA